MCLWWREHAKRIIAGRVDARLSGALNMLSLMRKVVGAATEDDEEVCTSRCLHPDPTPGQDSR